MIAGRSCTSGISNTSRVGSENRELSTFAGETVQTSEGHSDRPKHSACSPLPIYSRHSRLIPFFAGISLVSVAWCESSTRKLPCSFLSGKSLIFRVFRILYPDRSRSREIPWYIPSRIMQGGANELPMWCCGSPEHRARCSRYSGHTGHH